MNHLSERTIRGGFAKVCSQAANFILRIGSLMVLGRLLNPKDFGMVGMVTAITGVLYLFRDFGLSTATVQRRSVTDEQISTLFWINVSVGLLLGLLCLAAAPFIAAFYREPRLFGIAAVLATGFLVNAAGVQHWALLERQMRFTVSAVIDLVSLVVSIVVGIGLALGGYGYWALVAMAAVTPFISTGSVWLIANWVPGLPRRGTGIRQLMRFGGTVTLNGLTVYVAYNLEKILLGRFWGAGAIGIYGRAYQLASIPTENLNSAVGGVMFSALSRLQHEPARHKSYFLKAYSSLLALTLPLTIVCALFADDLIFVLLGPKWKEAAPIFRLLSPTILILAMINPLAWLLFSVGMVGRSFRMGLAIAPLVMTGYILGLPYGPRGVAFGYSAVMTLWVVPHIALCIRGTTISLRDITLSIGRPFLSGLAAAAFAFALEFLYGRSLAPLPRLILGATALLTVYAGMLLYVMGQKEFYLDLVRGLLGRRPMPEPAMASV
jgi:O-antigen/teichoic acid export membrane protein